MYKMKCKVPRAVRLLTIAILCAQAGAVYAMSIGQVKALPGADLLGQNVAELFDQCGVPDVILDRGLITLARRQANWNDLTMHLSDGFWSVRYEGIGEGAGGAFENGWINPHPVKSECFSALRRVTLLAQGGAGILTVDRGRHKTTYKVPDDLFMAHKVIAYEASPMVGMSLAEMEKTYGRNYEIVQQEDNIKVIRYWVIVESGQMPVAAYAVDFEMSGVEPVGLAFRVATSDCDFVRRKLQDFISAWEKYGID